MPAKKSFPLRVDPKLYEVLERWAADEFRSVNAHIEYVLRDAAARAGRLGGAQPPSDGPPSVPPLGAPMSSTSAPGAGSLLSPASDPGAGSLLSPTSRPYSRTPISPTNDVSPNGPPISPLSDGDEPDRDSDL